MGREVALHATATGKVWLASLPKEQACELVLGRGFGTPDQHGPGVIQSLDQLLAELRTTRERGFGLAWEEADPGIAAVAVGIRSPGRTQPPLLGTISIAGPVFRLPKEKLVGWVPRLQATADELSALGSMLGLWRGTTPPSGVRAKAEDLP
jgi:DNA-binding IclR family transcriptional regulator